MSGFPSRGSRRRQDIYDEWLLDHCDLWKDLPSDREDVEEWQSMGLAYVANEMTRDGLFKKKMVGDRMREERVWVVRQAIGRVRQRAKEGQPRAGAGGGPGGGKEPLGGP